MPAPRRKGEDLNHFLSRAIPFLMKEGKKQSQAVAIAESMGRKGKKGKKGK